MASFFSIIVPVFNTSNDKLSRCINSILSQTCSDFELLLIDDGSSDECAAFLDSFTKQDDRIKIIHKKNEGSSVARNSGIQNASGKYISFVDSDDFLMPYVLDDAKKTIDKFSPDMAVGLAQRHYEDSTIKEHPVEEFNENFVLPCTEISSFVSHILGFTNSAFTFSEGYIGDGPWSRFCKTEIVKNTLFGTEGYCSDDTVWNLEVLPKCKSIAVVRRLWYMYMINTKSKTRRFRPNSPSEVKFRIQQEYNLVTSYNAECKKGVFIRIWRETDTLGRSFLFNKKNTMPFHKKFQIFKDFIKTPVYQEMLHGVSFEKEHNPIKKCLKSVCRHCALHGPVLVAYVAWMVFVRKSI